MTGTGDAMSRQLVVVVMLLSFFPAYAADVILWIEDGQWSSYHETLETLNALDAGVRHAYPPHFIAGDMDWVHVKDLGPGICILPPDRDAVAKSRVSAEAQVFLEALRRLSLQGAEERPVVDLPPPPNDVDMLEDLPHWAEKDLPYGALYTNTSLYMIGDVSVSIVLPESNGGSEDWTSGEIVEVLVGITSGLDWWIDREPNANLNIIYNLEAGVPTSYEPIEMSSSDKYLWVEEVMNELGYYTATGIPYMVLYDYINDQRELKGTDWAYVIFVVDSSNDVNGLFADGRFAFAALNPFGGGPYVFMTYDLSDYGVSNMDAVSAHETGHIFGAFDQYSGCDPSDRSGYMYYENQNCVDGGALNEYSIMKDSFVGYYLGAVDYYARGQIGWVDTDGDGILDIVDTEPSLSLGPPAQIESLRYSLSGAAVVNPCPAVNPSYNTVTINTIASVEYRLGDGPWAEATASDGTFDGPEESYEIDATIEGGANHTLECRAVNSEGNYSASLYETLDGVTGVPDLSRLALTAYPNPFNPHTEIRFTLPAPGQVHLAVYDVAGEIVSVLISGFYEAGDHAVVWDGTDGRGRNLPSGVYHAKLRAGGRTLMTKLTLVR